MHGQHPPGTFSSSLVIPSSLVAPSGFPDIGISVGNYGPEWNSGGIDQISEKIRFSGILVFER